jgi:hypothetical protein
MSRTLGGSRAWKAPRGGRKKKGPAGDRRRSDTGTSGRDGRMDVSVAAAPEKIERVKSTVKKNMRRISRLSD